MHVFLMFFAVLVLGAANSPPPPGFGNARRLPASPFAEWPDAPETPSTLISKVATKTTAKPSPAKPSPAKPSPVKTHTYSPCGGFLPTPRPCASGYACIDDPWRPGCGMACDMPGICVENIMCGGLIGRLCPAGMKCVYQPVCDPNNGGRDCSGICV